MLSLKCEKTVAVRIAFVAAFLLVVAACLGVSATNTLAAKTHWSDDGPIVGPAPGDGDGVAGYKIFVQRREEPGDDDWGDGFGSVLGASADSAMNHGGTVRSAFRLDGVRFLMFWILR